MRPTQSVVAIGGSAGGVTAVQSILSNLHKDFSIPIVIVLHISPTGRVDLSKVYTPPAGCRAFEVEDKVQLNSKSIYFATADYHLMIESDLSLSLSQDDAVHFSRPSIDVFFESLARAVGYRAIGVLLTGANQDGAAGLKEIALHGGKTVVQDPEEAECSYMPNAALAIMRPNEVLRLKEIANYLNLLDEKVQA